MAELNITGATKNLAVIGYPLTHSLSPAMQNAAIRHAGLDFVYIAAEVPPKDLATAVQGFRAMKFRGFNVTIPHKSAIIKLLDKIDDDAAAVGAVNTVVNDDGVLTGFNTDVFGFLDGLAECDVKAAGKSAAIFGAGGAARAVVRGLCNENIAQIFVGARNADKAAAFADDFGENVRGGDWSSRNFVEFLANADIVVNTTPLGMAGKFADEMPPCPLEKLRRDAFIYDIVYNPKQTKLLQAANARGYRTQNGMRMLAAQGAAAFRLWTLQDADTVMMKQVLQRLL